MSDGTNSGLSFRSEAGEATLLFVMPHSADTAYVWCPAAKLPSIAAIAANGQPCEVLARRKLIQPGNTLEILLVRSRELQDGALCELHFDKNERSPLATVARLARWDSPHTRRVLRIVADRFNVDQDPPRTLERYLAFISLWQIPGRVQALLPEGVVFEAEIASEGSLNAYVMTMQGVRRITLTPLSAGPGRRLFWLPGYHPQQFYLEADAELTRVVLDNTGNPYRPASENDLGLVESLHGLNVCSEAATAWVRKLCPRQAELRIDDTAYRILGSGDLPSGRTVIFIEVSGRAYAHVEFRLHSFGVEESAQINVTARETDGSPNDRPCTQILVEAPDMRQTGAYRLSWVHDGEPQYLWVRGSEIAERPMQALVRDFAPLAFLDTDLFGNVFHPIATASSRSAEAALVHREEFGGRSRDACAELLILADGDVEAVHRTLIALSLSSRETAFDVHICFFDRSLIALLTSKAKQWSALYGLRLTVNCFNAWVPESFLVRFNFGAPLPRVICRAGFIPCRVDWLECTLKDLELSCGILLGSASSRTDSRAREISRTALRKLIGEVESGTNYGITSAALLPHLGSIDPEVQFHGFESYVLALALSLSEGEKVRSSQGLRMSDSAGRPETETFEARLDRYSLQELCRRWAPVKARQTKGANPLSPEKAASRNHTQRLGNEQPHLS